MTSSWGIQFTRWLHSKSIEWAFVLGGAAILTITFERFIFAGGGFAVGDLQPFVSNITIADMRFGSAWGNESTGFAGTPLPYVLFEGALSQVLGNPSVAQSLFAASLLIVGSSGFFALIKHLGLSGVPGVVSALLYGFNPVSLTLIVIGSIPDNALAYALIPWLTLLAVQTLSRDVGWMLPGLELGALLVFGLSWNPQLLFWFLPVAAVLYFRYRLPSERHSYSRGLLRVLVVSSVVVVVSMTLLYGALSYLSGFLVSHSSTASTQLLGPTPAGFAIDLADNFSGQLSVSYAMSILFICGVLALLFGKRKGTPKQPAWTPFAILAIPVVLSGIWVCFDEFSVPIWVAEYAFYIGAYEPISQLGLDVFCLLLFVSMVRQPPPVARHSDFPSRLGYPPTLSGLAGHVPGATGQETPRQLEALAGRRGHVFLQIVSAWRRGQRNLEVPTVVGLICLLLFVPVRVGNEAWPTMSELATSPQSWAAYSTPTSIRQAGDWLQAHPAIYAGEKVAWLPVDPQQSAIISVLPITYGFFTHYTPNEWNQMFARLVPGPSPNYHTLGLMLAQLDIAYVVLLNQTPNTSFSADHTGQPRYTPFGWSWQLQYFPSGSTVLWDNLLASQGDLVPLYNTSEVEIYKVDPPPSPVSIYNVTGIDAAFSLRSIRDVAPDACLSCLPRNETGPVYVHDSNSVSNFNFSNGLSGWTQRVGSWNVSSGPISAVAALTAPGDYAQLEQIINVSGGLWSLSGWIWTYHAGDSREDVYEYDANGTLLGHVGPETGIQGTTDWAHYGGLFQLPIATRVLDVLLVAQSDPTANATTKFTNITANQVVVPPLTTSELSSSASLPAYSFHLPPEGEFLVILPVSFDMGWICSCAGSHDHFPYDGGLFIENAYNLTTGSKSVNATLYYAPSTVQRSIATYTYISWAGLTGALLIAFRNNLRRSSREADPHVTRDEASGA